MSRSSRPSPSTSPAAEPALPVGSQLVAAAGREDLLLQVSAQLEEAAPWAEKRPPIFG